MLVSSRLPARHLSSDTSSPSSAFESCVLQYPSLWALPFRLSRSLPCPTPVSFLCQQPDIRPDPCSNWHPRSSLRPPPPLASCPLELRGRCRLRCCAPLLHLVLPACAPAYGQSRSWSLPPALATAPSA